ncbi:MAG: altronate oxidoreductase, partial [Sediminibacterium sp.]
QYYGENNGSAYRIQDDKAALLFDKWERNAVEQVVPATLQDKNIFGADLTSFPGFEEAVSRNLELLLQSGAKNALRSILAKKSVA